MQRKRPKKQTKITGKKKKLSTGNKSPKQVAPRLTSRKSIERKDNKPVRAEDLPIVAIGASAGGIEAISKLLENLSPRRFYTY